LGDPASTEEQAHFETGLAILNGSQPETRRQMPSVFLTDIAEMLVAVTMPFMEGFAFSFASVETETWEILPQQKLEVMGFEAFAMGRTRLRCWRIRRAHPTAPRSYWVSEDRALVAAILGDEEYWLSDARTR
jgi:hypothetical protein